VNDAIGDNPALHAFGHWRFDAGTGDLSNATTITRLEPQVAKLLAYFLTHQDTLVSRDQLLAAVWDNRIVSDDAINRCISILRQALSPDDRNAYIETVVRRGFISHFPPALAETPPSAPHPRRRNLWVFGALTALAALILFGVIRMLGETSQPGRTAERAGVPMIAVLPFESMGQTGDSEFFASGMHDDLLTQLAQLQSIRVISRTSVYQYRDSDQSRRDIGRELGADAILEGGVQRRGDHIRINVQLIDAHSDVHLWAQQYDRELTATNIFDIQAEIARSIATALDSTLTQTDGAQLNALPTSNMAAYRAYHEAMALRVTESISAPAYIAALERAVTLDPQFVRAWAELAGAISYRNIGRRNPESILRLENMLEQIRALAPQSSEYLIAQAYYTYYVLSDYARALELIQQARSLRPSDVQVLELQSWIQRRLGDFNGTIESTRQARTLDPRNPFLTYRLVDSLTIAHRYDEAIAELEQSPVESFKLSELHSKLRVRGHRDPARPLKELASLQKEYGVTAEPLDLWEAHITSRDFAGAAASLDAVQPAELSVDDWRTLGFADIDLARLITNRFLDAKDPQVVRLAEARARLAQGPGSGSQRLDTNRNLAMAFITAVEGNAPETERLVRVWLREVTPDHAELALLRHYACRALGIAAAAAAAVECLRSGLREPSRVIPFIEPFLPYYDSLRSDPGFVEFLAEIQGV
jgi:TolB-like protein/DNA-binding winged helix-turn-helix (wHTH) protein